MRLTVFAFSSLVLLTMPAIQEASACPGAGGKASHRVELVEHKKTHATVRITSQAGVEAVKALQAKFSKKTTEIQAGKSPCSKCQSKQCLFRELGQIKGLKLSIRPLKTGVELRGTGAEPALVAFATAAREAGNPEPAKAAAPVSKCGAAKAGTPPVFGAEPQRGGCGCKAKKSSNVFSGR